MKTKHQTADDGDNKLDRILKSWEISAPLPPRFKENVWEAIARADSRPASMFSSTWMRLLEVVLPRPKVAISFAAILLVAGAAAGHLAAESQNSRLESDLGARYVQTISPFHTAANR
jgi:hypothetical protein